MSKKDLANVTADLSALASLMPTQRPAAAAPPPIVVSAPIVPAKPKARPEPEPVTQFSLSLRKELRKELAKLASDADMTMRAFVLLALKAKGLSVRSDDLVDLRRERH